MAGYDQFRFARNYTYADGHVRYVVKETRIRYTY